ncbi:MAG: hypothetical protein RIQ62_1009 [Bacteroidota bacterium]
MCGIAGILSKNTALVQQTVLKKMTDVIAHRGPDGEGHWISPNAEVGLGHRRLSIIDLSHEADQPMHFLDRYTIVFNGEIYNYLELRTELSKQGYQFRTQSDTEVLMALYDRDKEQCLSLLDGMFSFVLFDAHEQTAFCARDRFGEKPFFYSYERGSHFLFGSEMKCLWAGGIPKEINNRMLFNYLSYGYIENPQNLSETFYEKCTRLPHSHYIKINLNDLSLQIKKYYDIDWKNCNTAISVKEAQEKFHELFYTSVQRRLRSDVAVGSSLSGGLDSSLVVCVIDDIKKGSHQKQNTFSAVFPGYKKDERKFMDYVTSVTQVNPHYVTPNDEGLLADIDTLSWHQEEPYGSASIYAQYCVMKLAKENNTTVLLDGQGADEILAGYHPYYLPFFNELKRGSRSEYETQLKLYQQLHSGNPINCINQKTLGDRVRQISPSLVKPVKQWRNHFVQWKQPFFHSDFYAAYHKEIFDTPGSHFNTLNEALYNNTYVSGLQTLLRYADRNSMAHSREVRLPFLYHEMVEFLFSLPASFKIHDGWTKWIMRETFSILPKEISWRIDKIGYEPPQKNWMENEKVKRKILHQRDTLIDQHILNKKLQQGAYKAADALSNENNYWKMMLTQNLFETL